LASYGDTTAANNGIQYSPATQPIYDIDDSSMVCGPGAEPLKFKSPDIRDVKNEVTVEWTNRSTAYATNTLSPSRDTSMVAKYGRRPESTKTFAEINTQSVAVAVQNTLLKRMVNIEGGPTYEVTLPPHFIRLDPMDLITITDPYLGLNKLPLRIVSIEEDDKCCFKLKLESFPWSCSAPTLFPSQGHTPSQAGYFADPGSCNTPFFVEMPAGTEQGSRYVLGIAVSGSINWGGAGIYVSTDEGHSYEFLGMSTGADTMGSLTATLAAHADPDTTIDALQVSLLQSYGGLPSFTQAQADALVSLIAVDQELLSYETATLTGTYKFSLNYLRRGAYDTDATNHIAGAPFCVLDSTVFRYKYPASVIGKILKFKFCSVNLAGQRQQDISQVPEYSYFVRGPRMPYPLNAGFENPITGDALFTRQTFGVYQDYVINAKGDPEAQVGVLANVPISVYSTAVGAPEITAVSVGSGGSLPGGHTYFLQVFAFDAASNPKFTPPSAVASIAVPAGSSYKISFTVVWPVGSYGGNLFVAVDDTRTGLTYEPNTTLPSSGATTGTVVYTLSSVDQKWIGSPDRVFDHLVYSVRELVHGGIWGAPCSGVSTNTLTFAGLGGGLVSPPATGTDHWVSRVVSLLALPITATQDSTHRIPLSDFLVTASDTSGNLTVTPNPMTALGGSPVPVGSVFVMRSRQSTFSSTSVTDPDWANILSNAGSGLDSAKEVKRLAYIRRGTGERQPMQTIVSVSTSGGGALDTINVSPGWPIPPDANSEIVILKAPVEYVPGAQTLVYDHSTDTPLTKLSVQNEAGYTAFIQLLTTDIDGRYAPEYLADSREVYVWGSGGTRVISTDDTMLPTDGLVDVLTAGGPVVFTMLPFVEIPNKIVFIRKQRGNANTVAVRRDPSTTDTFDGAASVVLDDTDANYFTQIKVPG
jgi:hypothetical protein